MLCVKSPGSPVVVVPACKPKPFTAFCAAVTEAAACCSLFAAASAEARASVTLSLMDSSALLMLSTASVAVLLTLSIAVSAVSCNCADDSVDTCLLTVLRVENTRHCGFYKKHDITRIRFAITIDKSEVAFDPSRTQDSHGNSEVPSTVRPNTGHVITILVVRTRRIIQARPSETGDLLPVTQGDETDDLTVIVRLIDNNDGSC